MRVLHARAAARTAMLSTVEVPEQLLRNAQKQSREGVMRTVRKGLELLAAGEVLNRLPPSGER